MKHSMRNIMLTVFVMLLMISSAYADDFTALGRGQSAGRIIYSVSDSAYLNKTGKAITEKAISSLTSADYGKTGLIADGNSRLILRYRSSQPGTVAFSVSPEMSGATLETLTDRQAVTSALSTVSTGRGYQVSAVLIAPETWPSALTYPEGKFTVTATFTPSNGNSASTRTLDLTLLAAPVVLVHGVFGDNETAFGYDSGTKTGIWHKLENAGLAVASWNYDNKKSPTVLIANNNNGLAKTISATLDDLNKEGFEAARVDLVTHSSGGIMARQYLRNDIDTGNKTANSYGLGTVRRVVTVASPNLGTPIASYLAGNFETLPSSWQNWAAKSWWEGIGYGLIKALALRNNEDIEVTMNDLSLSSSYIAGLGYPGVPFHSVYGKVKSDETKINRLFDDVVNQNIVNLSKIDWLPQQLVDNLTSSKLAIISGVLKAMSDDIRFKELLGALFDSDDHDLVVSETSAKDIFPSNAVTSFEGLGAHNHVMIARQDDVGDRVLALLRGGTENFMINAVSSAEYDEAFNDYAEAFGKYLEASDGGYWDEYSDGSMILDTSILRTEYMGGEEDEPTIQSVKLSGTSEKSFSDDIYVVMSNTEGSAKFFKMTPDNDRSFDVNLWVDSANKGLYEVAFVAVQGGDTPKLKASAIAKVAFPPMLYNSVTELTAAYGGTIYGGVGDEVPMGLIAHTDGGNYDVSVPAFGLAEYSVSDTGIAEITEEGRVRLLKEGSAVITATAYGKTVSVNVIVLNSSPAEDIVKDLEITDDSSSGSYGGTKVGGGTSGGCSAGFGVLMLLSVLAFVRKSER